MRPQGPPVLYVSPRPEAPVTECWLLGVLVEGAQTEGAETEGTEQVPELKQSMAEI